MKVIVYFLGFAYIAIGSIFILYARESIDALKKFRSRFCQPSPQFSESFFLFLRWPPLFPGFSG